MRRRSRPVDLFIASPCIFVNSMFALQRFVQEYVFATGNTDQPRPASVSSFKAARLEYLQLYRVRAYFSLKDIDSIALRDEKRNENLS